MLICDNNPVFYADPSGYVAFPCKAYIQRYLHALSSGKDEYDAFLIAFTDKQRKNLKEDKQCQLHQIILGTKLHLSVRKYNEYNVFFEYIVPPELQFSSDYIQFENANIKLHEKLSYNTEFRKEMFGMYPSLQDWFEKGDVKSNIPGLTWHHNVSICKLDLVDHKDHNSNHKIYHPEHKGGRYNWGGGAAGRVGHRDGKTGEIKDEYKDKYDSALWYI